VLRTSDSENNTWLAQVRVAEPPPYDPETATNASVDVGPLGKPSLTCRVCVAQT